MSLHVVEDDDELFGEDDDCICDWPSRCDGSGNLTCSGCSGDSACWCACGGDSECPGCPECAEQDDDDLDDED